MYSTARFDSNVNEVQGPTPGFARNRRVDPLVRADGLTYDTDLTRLVTL